MTGYILKRLGLAAVTLLAILFTSYVLLRLAPGDPTRSDMLGGDGQHGTIDSKGGQLRVNTALREKLALDKPILTGFALWLKAAARGDFGESASVDPGRSVTEMIFERLPLTVRLNCWAIALTYLLAIPIGVFSAAVAFGLEFYLYQYLLRDIVASATNSAAGGGIIMGDFSGYALVLGLGFLAVGLFAGVISSSVSLKKYLKA